MGDSRAGQKVWMRDKETFFFICEFQMLEFMRGSKWMQEMLDWTGLDLVGFFSFLFPLFKNK